MNEVASIRASTGAPPSGASGMTAHACDGALLPEAPSLETTLLEAQVLVRTLRSRTELTKADVAGSRREQALTEAREAMATAAKEEREAAHKGKWVKALQVAGTIAGVAVGVVSIACSGGATTPAVVALAGLAISASSPYVADATHNEKLGLALAISGAALSLGAGIVSATASTAGQMSTATKVVLLSGKMAGATAEVGTGAATYSRGTNEKAALLSRADAQAASCEASKQQAEVEDAIAMLGEIEASARRAMNAIIGIADDRRATGAELIHNMRRA